MTTPHMGEERFNAEVWRAWHAGQRVSDNRAVWKELGDAMVRTSEDVIRENCLADLARERDIISAQLLAIQERLSSRLNTLHHAIDRIQMRWDWQRAYREAKEELR